MLTFTATFPHPFSSFRPFTLSPTIALVAMYIKSNPNAAEINPKDLETVAEQFTTCICLS